MRCSKVTFAAFLLIFSLVFGVQLLILYSEDGGRRSHLTDLLSVKWHSSEFRPDGETWISGISGISVNSSVASSEQRLKSVREVCRNTRKSWDSLSITEKQILAKHILVNDEHRFLYCSVPKVACSNWKRVMMVLDGEASDSNAIKKVNHQAFTVLADLPPLSAKRKLQEYYKFMFVREPLVRLLSAYKDKFFLNNTAFHQSFGRKIVKHVRKNAPANSKGDDVTLEEFLQYVVDSRAEDMNEHWMPFYELCQPCVVSYDFIGSLENLESDSTHVLKQLNINEQVSFPRQQKYYQAGGNGYVKSKKVTKIPSDMTRKVLKKYSLDYKMFSYQMPIT